MNRVRLEQRLARAGGLLHVGQHQRGHGVRDEGGDLRADVGGEHLRLGEGVQIGRGRPGGDVLHGTRADGQAGESVRLLPAVDGAVTEKGGVDLAGDVPGQAPADLGDGLRRGVLGQLGSDDGKAGDLAGDEIDLGSGQIGHRDPPPPPP